MSDGNFAPTTFIKEKNEKAIDLSKTPYFYNDAGKPTYHKTLPPKAKLIPTASTDPQVAMGNEYVVAKIESVKKTPPYGIETQLKFVPDADGKVEYAPLWVTPAIAAAFGITLVEPGQAVQLASPVAKLSQVEYEYGVFAGHWSPYQKAGSSKAGNVMLSVVATDLEHHDFPHIFASTDPSKPLVTSVGRYWPSQSKIRLADLWVPQGCALYIPPKAAVANAACIDLHNNRNSARACWGDIHQGSVLTKTLLQLKDGFFYWYWNPADTVHSQPTTKD
jgi:hypothetical protein